MSAQPAGFDLNWGACCTDNAILLQDPHGEKEWWGGLGAGSWNEGKVCKTGPGRLDSHFSHLISVSDIYICFLDEVQIALIANDLLVNFNGLTLMQKTKYFLFSRNWRTKSSLAVIPSQWLITWCGRGSRGLRCLN